MRVSPENYTIRWQVVAVITMVLVLNMVGGAHAQVAQPVPVLDLTGTPLPPEKLSVAERLHAEDHAVDLRVGSFTLSPTIAAGEEFEQNVFSSHSGAQSDFITLVHPAFDLVSDWGLDALALHGEANVLQYGRFHSENEAQIVLQSNGRLDLARGEYLAVGAGYQSLYEPRSSPDSIEAVLLAGGTLAKYPTEYVVETGFLNYVYGPGPIKFELDNALIDYQFSNEPTTNGGIAINGDRNRTEFTVTPRLGYEFSPGYQAYVQVSGDRRQYEATYDATPDRLQRTSSGYAAAVGLDFDVNFAMSGSFYAGYQGQLYDDPRLGTTQGTYFGGSLLWNASDFTSVKLTASRSIQDTILLGSSGFWDTQAQIAVEHELRPDLLLTGELRIIDSAYQGIPLTDDQLGLGFGGVWRLDRDLSVNASAEWLRQTSNQALGGFDQEVMQLSLKLAL